MVRAGKNAILIDEFEKLKVVAIGWDLGDLTNKNSDEIKELVYKKYPNNSNHTNGKIASNIIKFRHELKKGDYVLSYNSWTHHYLFGRITSDYYYDTSLVDDYFSDVRNVEWLGEIPKDKLKKSTQTTLNTQKTVFNIKEDAIEDILNAYNLYGVNQMIENHVGGISNSQDCPVNIIKNYLTKNNLILEMGEYDKNLFSKFKKLYSPEVLKSLEGIDVLETIFPQNGNKSNLCYALEFSKEFKWLCGGIRGGSAFKFSLFKYGKTNKWTAGSSKNNLKTLTESEAIELAVKIRDAIVEGVEYIENSVLESVEDYIRLEEELNRLFSEVQKDCPINPTHSWIHKYYSIIYPDKIPIVHADKMKKEMLRKFRIEPEDGFYANDGQLYELSKKVGINLYSLFDEKIVRLFFESKSIWDPIKDGHLVELKECVKFNEQLKNNFKRNIIYFGAPGTGKSYNLNQDKNNLLKYYPNNYERVTFYPDFSYANFVGTYKPVPENDSITYKYVPGPFMRVLVKALDNPNEPYLLIIEEINRANVAAVFGDIFQLLDRTNSNDSEYPINTSEDVKEYLKEKLGKKLDKIKIPQNMFIWATMNSADQGVFAMDTAFKRRWDFKYFSINHNEKLTENIKVNINGREIFWNELRKAINEELLAYKINEDKLIGPFFAFNEFQDKQITETEFKEIFKNKIIMYLFEDAAKSKRNELFSGVTKNTNLTYSQICEYFEKNGIEIFTESVKEKFILDEVD